MLQIVGTDAAPGSHLLSAFKLLESLNGGLNQVMWIMRPDTFG
jgi:hypothetical protein